MQGQQPSHNSHTITLRNTHTITAPWVKVHQPSHNAHPLACALLCFTTTGASSGSGTTTSHYGTFPSLLLDPLIEHIRDVVEAKQDLAGMGRSLANAYTLYLKTRPSGRGETMGIGLRCRGWITVSLSGSRK